MRLLNVETMQLELFLDEDKLPPYTILSHCWGEEEVTLQDLQSGTFRHLRGSQKIDACCRKTPLDLCKYTWIDTCCIDKTSSAELSEAINSMYRWYEKAAICYAFLEDVAWDLGEGTWVHNEDNKRLYGYRSDSANVARLREARWFQRGWTLQELIAPGFVVFFDQQWREIGERKCMAALLSEITGISKHLMARQFGSQGQPLLELQALPVATRMAWASMRTTTRPEDEAYCLLGLFGINMPLIYGEGRRAFLRLQREIIMEGGDASILLWSNMARSSHGVLAPSPANFKQCRGLELSQLSTKPTALTPTIQLGTGNRTITLKAQSISYRDLSPHHKKKIPSPVLDEWQRLDMKRGQPSPLMAIVARTTDRLVGILLAEDEEGRFGRQRWSVDFCYFPECYQEPRTIVLLIHAASQKVFLPVTVRTRTTVVAHIHTGYTMSQANSPNRGTVLLVFTSDTASLPPFAVAQHISKGVGCCLLPEKTPPEDENQWQEQLDRLVKGLQQFGTASMVLVPGMYFLTVAFRWASTHASTDTLTDRLIVSMVPHAGVHVADGEKWAVQLLELPVRVHMMHKTIS